MSGQHRRPRGEPPPSPDQVPRARPSPFPSWRPRVQGEVEVCPSCRAWWFCCYCQARPEIMRAVVTELLDSHEAHGWFRCPVCPRLRDAMDAVSTEQLRRALRRLAELHIACDLTACPDRQRLFQARHG